MHRLIAIMLASLFLIPTLRAQMKKDFPVSGAKTIQIYMDRSEVIIEGSSASSITVETDDLKAPPERAKGLKPLYNNATDNTGVGLDMKKEGDVIVFRKASNQGNDYKFMVPRGMNVKIEETSWQGGSYSLSNLSGEIEVASKNSPIEIKNVTGPVTANSTSGSIEVVFGTLNPEKPSYLSNISGFIDVSLSAGAKVNLKMDNISGEIYSNHDIEQEKKDDMNRLGGGRKIQAALNGGGVEINLKNISGDIYLRKK